MKRLKLLKIQLHLQDKIDDIIIRILSNTPYYEFHKEVRGYIADVARGRAHTKYNVFTVPLWAYKPDYPKNIKSNGGYFVYYVAHELSHLISYKVYGGRCNHDSRFYHIFTNICPEEYQHFELAYIKSAVNHIDNE